MNVRIGQHDLDVIIIVFKKAFGENDHLWLFGSRADMNKRGGDLDFYIETIEPNFSDAVDKKMAFISELWQKLGDQKIDVVLNVLSSKHELPIYTIAKATGVKLV
jgi:hypothetical protein